MISLIDSNVEGCLVELAKAVCELTNNNHLPITAEQKTLRFNLLSDSLVFGFEGENGVVSSIEIAVEDVSLILDCSVADFEQFMYSTYIVSSMLQVMHEMGCSFDYSSSLRVVQGQEPGDSEVVSAVRGGDRLSFRLNCCPLLALRQEEIRSES